MKSGLWFLTKCALEEVTGGWGVTKANFECFIPDYADQWAIFNNNNEYDIFSKAVINEPDFETRIRAKDALHVKGEPYGTDGIIYENAYGNGIHLVYKVHHGSAPELQKLVIIDSHQGANKTFTFELSYTGTPEISPSIHGEASRIEARNNSKILLETPSPVNHNEGFYIRQWDSVGKRGSGIKKPEVWDSGIINPKREIISMPIRRKGAGLYEITKTVTKAFQDVAIFPMITDAVFTFYPEPHPPVTAGDGFVWRSGVDETFTAMRNGAGIGADSNDASGNLALIQASTTTDQYAQTYRSEFLFDTSSLAGLIILSASLNIRGSGKNSTLGGFVKVDKVSPASDLIFVNSDFNIVNHGMESQSDTVLPISAWNAAGYNVLDLNNVGIGNLSLTDVSRYGLKTSFDLSGNAPAWQSGAYSFIQGHFTDEVGTGLDPYLEVITNGQRGRTAGGTGFLGRLGMQ